MILANRQEGLEPLQKALEDASRMVRIRAAEALRSLFNPSQSAIQRMVGLR